jgi:hypothetical protein
MGGYSLMREAVRKHGFSKQRQPGLEVNVSTPNSTCAFQNSQLPIRRANGFKDLTGLRFVHL